MNDRIQYAVLLLSTGLFTACAATTIQSIHHTPDFRSDTIHQVMVICESKDPSLRKTLEDEFVRQWSLHGVKAVSSEKVLPSTTPLNKGSVAPLAKAQGFDTVLVTRLLAKQTVNPGERPIPYPDTSSQNDNENRNTLMQVLLAPPVYATEYDLATVETDLYDVVSGQRVWSAKSETEVMGKIPKLIPPFVKLILKRLYQTP